MWLSLVKRKKWNLLFVIKLFITLCALSLVQKLIVHSIIQNLNNYFLKRILYYDTIYIWSRVTVAQSGWKKKNVKFYTKKQKTFKELYEIIFLYTKIILYLIVFWFSLTQSSSFSVYYYTCVIFRSIYWIFSESSQMDIFSLIQKTDSDILLWKINTDFAY